MTKLKNLAAILSKYKSAIIAYSGGVDSALLAKVAGNIIKGKVVLVTATSSTYPSTELEDAIQLAKEFGLKHKIIESEETEIAGFAENPPDRCYYCKKELFEIMHKIAKEESCEAVFDGSNLDDLDDYRPGRRAICETGTVSPLIEAKLNKQDVRDISKILDLSTASKPALACLASRFPYGETITKEKLNRVGEAEHNIKSLGFTQIRVRSHNELARIEFIPSEINKGWELRSNIEKYCLDAGYKYVAIDTKGYRMGAMNETLEI